MEAKKKFTLSLKIAESSARFFLIGSEKFLVYTKLCHFQYKMIKRRDMMSKEKSVLPELQNKT